MNSYMSIPGFIQPDKGIITHHGTIAKPRADLVRVNSLAEGDRFKMDRHLYKVTFIGRDRVNYSPYVYNKIRKRSYLHIRLKFSFGCKSMWKIALIN